MGTDSDKHRYFEGMAVAHVLGGLDESDGRVFRSHLLQCPECRAHVGELRALAHELADVERDERRVRAAKSVETKRREDTEDDDHDDAVADAPPVVARFPRLLVLLGVLALVGLAAWNMTLRTTVANQRDAASTVTDGAELLAFGDEVDWTATDSDIQASIRTLDDRLVLLVAGLDDEAGYSVYQLGSDDRLVDVQGVDARAGVIHYLVELREDARTLLLTRSAADPPDDPPEGPSGERLLEATLP